MFVGVGASRVRDLFKKAKENAPCLVFVDEIDAVGRSRGTGIGGGNDEREQARLALPSCSAQRTRRTRRHTLCLISSPRLTRLTPSQTLNQLLTEMDGFEGNTGIIVIAATNRADILDPALMRPGRFDRQVQVDVPDVKGRIAILGVHSRNKKLEEEVSGWVAVHATLLLSLLCTRPPARCSLRCVCSQVDLQTIALRTPGFSGADLANLLNEAAILTGRRNKTSISLREIDDSVDRIVAGMEGKPLTDGKAKSLVAYHEVGHAICGTLTRGHDAVQKVRAGLERAERHCAGM